MASNSLSHDNEVDEGTPLIGSRPTTEPNGTAHGTQPGDARSLLRNPRFYRGFLVIFIAGVCLAISDSLIQNPFVRFCKGVICCGALRGREGCRDYKRCEEAVGQIVNHEFSSLIKMQTISNSVFGTISLLVWLSIWSHLSRVRNKPVPRRNVLVVAQIGVFLLEFSKFILIKYGLTHDISPSELSLFVTLLPVSSILGGGSLTYWAYREDTISALVSKDYRTPAYFSLALAPKVIQAGVSYFVLPKLVEAVGVTRCLVAGCIAAAAAIAVLFTLEQIPSLDSPPGPNTPSDASTRSTDPPDVPMQPTTSPNVSTQPYATPDTPTQPFFSWVRPVLKTRKTGKKWRLVLLLLATFPTSILLLSLSNFSVLYVGHKFSIDVIDAGRMMAVGIGVNVLVLIVRTFLFAERKNTPLPAKRKETPPQTDVAISAIFLATSSAGSVLMAVAQVPLVFNFGLLFANLGSDYTSFLKSALAKWSPQDGRLGVFASDTVLEAMFRVFGALLLDWGQQNVAKFSFSVSFVVVAVACLVWALILLAVSYTSDEDYDGSSSRGSLNGHANGDTTANDDSTSAEEGTAPDSNDRPTASGLNV